MLGALKIKIITVVTPLLTILLVIALVFHQPYQDRHGDARCVPRL